GTTLARSPIESGQNGVTLVDVDTDGSTTLTFLPTSPIRWVEERIELESGATIKQLRSEIQKRIGEYRSIKSRDDLIISWIVDCPGGALPSDLREGTVAKQLLEEMRSDYGIEPPICWSLSVVTTLPEMLTPNLYDQKTILGDFLRAARHFQLHPFEPISLLQFLPKDYRKKPFGNRLPITPTGFVSVPELKRLLFDDQAKELTELEEVKLNNLYRKLREARKFERAERKLAVPPAERKKRKSAETLAELQRRRNILLRRKMRRNSNRVVKRWKKRVYLMQMILREVSALGWDLLGERVENK
ncbi:MAG: hypothetical protein ACRC2T_03125, partial [Thermoguttaceae bacterium]